MVAGIKEGQRIDLVADKMYLVHLTEYHQRPESSFGITSAKRIVGVGDE